MNGAPGRPAKKPAVPHFSSGPCAKRPGWSVDALKDALVGRSHRAAEGKARLAEVIERSRAILGIPADWRLLVDERVVGIDRAIVGAGVRGAKLFLPGALLAELPGAEVLTDLAG